MTLLAMMVIRAAFAAASPHLEWPLRWIGRSRSVWRRTDSV